MEGRKPVAFHSNVVGLAPEACGPGEGGPMRPFHWFKNGCQLVGLSLTPAINKLIWLQGTEAVVHWGWG